MRNDASFQVLLYLYCFLVASLNSILYQSLTSRVALVSPQAMSLLKPETTPMAPGRVAPNALCCGVASCITNQMEGKLRPKCGSFANMGLPEYDLLPEIAQLLLPLSGSGFSMVSATESRIIPLSGVSVIFTSIKPQSVSFGIIGSFTSKKSGYNKLNRSSPNNRNALVNSKS